MAFECLSVHTVGEMSQEKPLPDTGWLIFRVNGKEITAQLVNKIVWDRGYFWGEYDGERHLPSLRPEEIVHVIR